GLPPRIITHYPLKPSKSHFYLDLPEEDWIEFDSMINVRPSQNNRTRHVESLEIRNKILEIVRRLVIRD
ncbi:MAG: DUF5674 family protein, partial [Nitrospirota bacterium]